MSKSSFDSHEVYDVIHSNISFINVLREEHFREDEIASDARRSYYVDYYLAQINNGGFSQFVYNTRWSQTIVALVDEGLESMGATAHRAQFSIARGHADSLANETLEQYFGSEYFGDNDTRDVLEQVTDAIFEVSKTEDLIELNAAWLRQLPHLRVLEIADMRAEIDRRVRAMGDRDDRVAAARADEPPYTKLIRRLCESAGHELSHVTAGDPSHEHNGVQLLAWHFITDKGHHYMVEEEAAAIMFAGESNAEVARV